MKRSVLFSLTAVFLFASCVNDGSESYSGAVPPPPGKNEHTLFVYMPWSTNLTEHFRQNISDLQDAMMDGILQNSRLVVFFATSPTEASLSEYDYKGGKIFHTILNEYTYSSEEHTPLPFTTAQGITSILQEVKAFAPASRYSMIIGAHGTGWLPVTTEPQVMQLDGETYHQTFGDLPLTRYFGGKTPDVQTEISVLAKGIMDAGMRMDYILFDDCYMSSVEVAYDLRAVTDYLIASPTEVMAFGFPYRTIGKFLTPAVDLQGVCDGFYEYYTEYKFPYGVVAVTVTSELDSLAVIMKEINGRFKLDPAFRDGLQRMDGYAPSVFFDMADYVSKLCTDKVLWQRFTEQFNRAVPTNLCLYTDNYYAAGRGKVPIKSCSGITTSDPSLNLKTSAKTQTAWYKATH